MFVFDRMSVNLAGSAAAGPGGIRGHSSVHPQRRAGGALGARLPAICARLLHCARVRLPAGEPAWAGVKSRCMGPAVTSLCCGVVFCREQGLPISAPKKAMVASRLKRWGAVHRSLAVLFARAQPPLRGLRVVCRTCLCRSSAALTAAPSCPWPSRLLTTQVVQRGWRGDSQAHRSRPGVLVMLFHFPMAAARSRGTMDGGPGGPLLSHVNRCCARSSGATTTTAPQSARDTSPAAHDRSKQHGSMLGSSDAGLQPRRAAGVHV